MSWTKVEGRSTPLSDDVRIAFRDGDKKRHAGYAVGIGIGVNVMEKLGWNADMRVDLYWGDGKDEGWCKIVHNDRGRLVLRRKGSTHRSAINLACGQLPAYIKRERLRAQHTEFNVLGGDLLVRVPAEMIERPKAPKAPYVKKCPDENRGRPRKSSPEIVHKSVDNVDDKSNAKHNGHLTV